MILEIDSHQNITLSNYARRHFQYRNKNCTCLKILFTNARVTEMQREKEKSKNFMACWLHKKGIIKHLKGLKRITTHSKELDLYFLFMNSVVTVNYDVNTTCMVKCI